MAHSAHSGSGAVVAALAAALFMVGNASADGSSRELDLRQIRAIEGGGHAYYRLQRDDVGTYLHSEFRRGDSAVKQALVLPDSERGGRHRLTWRWRVLVMPNGGNECDSHAGDSAASVYIGWRRGLKWYGLKYVWSTVGPLGAFCDRHDTPIMRGEAVILKTGGPVGTWATESIDLEAEFRKHFAGGDPNAEVPELYGVAVLTDGDDTHSDASADFGSFVMTRSAP
jgi:Protein of unknown function (DUF3047)